MPVVSDTSPISYLVLIGEASLLPALYGQILIPAVVRRELSHDKGPAPVREWIASSPSWVATQDVSSDLPNQQSRREDDLTGLDPGEQAAILLAEREEAELLLIDERAGRNAAQNRGLKVTGTIGVLGAAVRRGHVDATRVVRALRDTTFRASPDLYRWLLSQQE